jgi:hypothetical protein
MSDLPSSRGAPKRTTGQVRSGCLSKFLLVVVVLFLAVIVGLDFLITLPFTLLFGWMGFLAKVFAELTWNWMMIVTGVLCMGVFVVGFHLTASWLRRTMLAEASPWPWRWTVLVTAGVMLVFTASISVIGILHQSIWLVTSGEPALRSNFEIGPEIITSQLREEIYRETERRQDKAYQPTGADVRKHLPMAIRSFRNPDVQVTVLSDPKDLLTGLVIDLRGANRWKGVRAYRWIPNDRRFERLNLDADGLVEFIARAQSGRPMEPPTTTAP